MYLIDVLEVSVQIGGSQSSARFSHQLVILILTLDHGQFHLHTATHRVSFRVGQPPLVNHVLGWGSDVAQQRLYVWYFKEAVLAGMRPYPEGEP